VAVILKVAYGYQITSNDDPLVHLLDTSFHLMASITIPGKYWVEFAPIRMYFPIYSQRDDLPFPRQSDPSQIGFLVQDSSDEQKK
jgi:hypothetical protein